MLKEQTQLFFPNLDGLRVFAFLAVFVNHALAGLGYKPGSTQFVIIRDSFLLNGDLGVSFFFVLSGFLITYILLKEKEIDGKINIKNFYFRRVLRIWPLYFFIVFLCLFLFPLFKDVIPVGFPFGVNTDTLNPWLYIGFAGNFDYLFHGISNVLIGVLWSVSVEEQFYLFWPLLIAFIPRKYLFATFISIIIGSILFRYFYSHGGIAIILKYHSFSCVTYLTMGAVIAYIATKNTIIEKFRKTPKWFISFMYLLFLALIPYRGLIWKFGIHYVLAASIAPVLFALLFAFFILEQNYADNSFYKVGNWKFISSFGKYTYGMYCYHMLVFFMVLFMFYLMGIDITTMSTITFSCVSILSLLLVIFISRMSYLYFELQFLKLKNRFSSIVKD